MDRAISVVICLVWKMCSLVAGMGVGVKSMPTGSSVWGGLKLPHEPKGNITHDLSQCINEDVSYKSVAILDSS